MWLEKLSNIHLELVLPSIFLKCIMQMCIFPLKTKLKYLLKEIHFFEFIKFLKTSSSRETVFSPSNNIGVESLSTSVSEFLK